jgi:uncharacterized protein (TIGR02466 family)
VKIHRQQELLFATPLHIVQFFDTGFCDRAVAAIYALGKHQRISDDDLHWCTPDDLHVRPEFQELKSLILQEATLLFDNLGVIRTGEKMTCMWANISKAKNRHAVHMHANSYYSGVIYLNTPSNPGNIGFKDPRPGAEVFAPNYTEESIYKHRTREVQPEKGRLIFFPSWLHHGTARGTFDDSEDRISLSFNLVPEGPMTGYSRKLEL